MKKLAAILLCIIMALSLFACSKKQATPSATSPTGQTDEETIPTLPVTIPTETLPDETGVFKFGNGTNIFGADVSGMTQEDAYIAVCAALDAYTLNLNVNGRSISFAGSQIGLTCPETAFADLVAAVTNGEDPSNIELLNYDSSLVWQKLNSYLNVAVKNASVRYNSAIDTFQVTDASSGKEVDINSIMQKLDPIILNLGTSLTVTATEKEVEPTITAESDQVKSALSKANAMLELSLTYSYTPDNKPTQYETLTKDDIASFISFDDDLNLFISSSALRNYVSRMNTKYSVKGDAGQFKTSGGYYINLTVDYAGQPVNTDALYDDIHYCLSNSISGTRTAPYLDVIECEEMAFDGNYVEVNLSAQYLWVYRNGNCVVSTPIVSGCAYYHNTTPTGVYSIYGKSTNVYLVGETWNSFVNYWMPFKGGYGLHDASWRSEFGGDIYLYDGSHGCVNLPSGVAGSVFNNIQVGTKVILYGGATSAEPVQQNIIGTAQYDVPMGTQPFKLDAQPEYGDDKTLSYISSDPAVADVTADGTVTIYGPGTATITATASERQYYTSAQMTITINVTDPCSETGHAFDTWVITAQPTCTQPGSQSHTCSGCGITESEEIPVLGHSFGQWTQTAAPTCTADGEQSHTCGTCSTTETQVIPATGHSVSQWNITKDATCTATGSKEGVCGTCGQTDTQTIPTLDHSFSGGGASCDYGCGTANPNYMPPQEEEEYTPSPENSGSPAEPAE